MFALTRVIGLPNTRFITTRTGAYAVATAPSEDGFAADATRTGGTAVSLPRCHSPDTNVDARRSLLEFTRVIEVYNTRQGRVRTRAYRLQPNTKNNFAPDP